MEEITINSNNKEEYSNGTYPKVTSIIWLIGELDENILKNFPNLSRLNCSGNQISDLSPLSYCKALTELSCNDNQITDLSPLRQCCSRLTQITFSFNQIVDLSPLQYCTELRQIACFYNKITSLESLIYLRRLHVLWADNNPLNPPSIQVARFLERLNTIYITKTIYNDTQNVHDTQVQQTVMDSVRNLMRDNNVLELDIDSVLTSELQANTKSRLLEYFEDNEPHIILLITYKELFTYVWNRIINNPNKLELLKILDDNIQDSECKCFTGRFNRTLSTLVGFYDDIEINISDSSRISAIILQIKDTIIPYDPDKHKEMSIIALQEAGYDQNIIDLWIENI